VGFRKLLTSREPRYKVIESAVPPGMQIAGAWSWRLLAIGGVLAVLIFLVVQLRLIVIPLMVAVLLAALLVPLSQWLQRHRWPKWLAVAVCEIGLIAVVGGLVTLVVFQIRAGFPELQRQTVDRVEEFKVFLRESPLHLTDGQINDYIDQTWQSLASENSWFAGALSVGSTAGHVFAGILLTLFATLFILIDGRSIWTWMTRIFPARAHQALTGAGEAGWLTLTTFVKVQIFVAAVDAVGIGLGAFFLGLPLVIPVAIAVFLGSFVPVVGAVVTGVIAVFIALVFKGGFIALIMLIIVLAVQQIEGHVLQPLVMGTAVKVHPLAVVIAVAAGGFTAGIAGALFAVPVVAALNVMISYIARGEWRTNPHPTVEDVVAHG